MMALREAALRARPDRFELRPGLMAACAAGLALLAAGWWAVDRSPDSNRVAAVADADAGTARLYQTGVGERSTVALPDGSAMTLNTASVVQVAYDGTERKVVLLSGQAMFTVAHHQTRPFRVYAGDRIVTATGTAFEVYLDRSTVRVALLEGSVKVARRATPGHPAGVTEDLLSAGEVLIAAPDAPTRVRTANVERLASWRAGLVSFDDTPLSEAVPEINRYAVRPLALADAEVGRHRISGTFRVGEPERFAQTLGELFPIRIDTSEDGRTVLSSDLE